MILRSHCLAYVGGKSNSTYRLQPQKKAAPCESAAQKEPRKRRGSVWQVTTQSNGAALMR